MQRYPRFASVAFVVFLTSMFASARCSAQELTKGISVEMAVTTHAVAMPDADRADASVVAVTKEGRAYFGIDPITPGVLADKHGLENLYIKVDARTPYAKVAAVLDSARKAGVTAPSLLTAQKVTPEAGKPVPPMGLEVNVEPWLPSGPKIIVVQVRKAGQQTPGLKIDNQVVPYSNLEARLRQLFMKRSEKEVFVKADGQLPYARVVDVIDALRATRAKVYLLTSAT